MDNQSVTTILFLAANPTDTSRLRLDKELQEIDEGLRRSIHRDRFELKQRWAVRPRDAQLAVMELNPHIVHFSGHGHGSEEDPPSSQVLRKLVTVAEAASAPEGLVLEDESGQARLMSTEALAGLFTLPNRVECVLLNACYSAAQAKAIAQHIPYVIGMNRAIGDAAALAFAVGFYDALGVGWDIESAFQSGRVAIKMAGIPEESKPKLMKRSDLASVRIESPADLEEPSGQVPLDSAFYIDRPPLENRCYEAVLKPGALIRIKAPRQVGKSSLMIRILNEAKQKGYQATWLSLQRADDQALENLDGFLKWLCACVSRNLRLPNEVEAFWQQEATLGSNDRCTYYFEEHLLEKVGVPLALCLDEVDELFKHEQIARDFLGLLRAWHEEAKISPLWCNLRLIITHSKEVYIPLNINQSPFNVGLPIELPPFTQPQVHDLIQRHGLDGTDTHYLTSLMDLTGGHPYLVRVALYYLARHEITLPELLKVAPTQEWFYGDHLRHHLETLQKNAKLKEAMQVVVRSHEPVRIDEAFKLASIGLVKFHGNDVVPLCGLYRQYFADMLS